VDLFGVFLVEFEAFVFLFCGDNVDGDLAEGDAFGSDVDFAFEL
jgi:hypothetical protein